MKIKIIFLTLFLICSYFFLSKNNDENYYKVVKITDGDTITVLNNENKEIKIRLAEIDAPESKQDYGQKSKQILSNKIYNQYVKVEKINIDRYGRTIAKIYLNDRYINEEMIKEGYAWHYKQFSKSDYLDKLQQEAKNNKIGLWNKQAVEPSEFRKKK